ncbi:MAG: hypothetical protein ABI232_10990 [Jatrophihabitantaceae bacterium]
MPVDQRWGGDEFDEPDPVDPSWSSPYVDGAWLRTANPNSVDGELQNLAAFGTGLTRLTGPRRTAARFVVWLILLGTALTIVYGAVAIIRIW